MQYRQSVIHVCSAIGILVLLGVGMVCAQPPSDPKSPKSASGQPPPAPENGGPVVLTLTTDKKTYKDTDPIHITLTAKNTTKAPIALRFSSGQKYDIEI